MKRSTKKILQRISAEGWWESLKQQAGNLFSGTPSLNADDIPAFDKLKVQAKALSDQLNDLLRDSSSLGMEGDWGLENLKNANDYLKHFSNSINTTKYEIVYEKPGEEIK